MTRDEIQKVRDELMFYVVPLRSESFAEVMAILDAALAAPEQEPVACKHFRYSVDVHEQIGNCLDCGAEGRMRFVVAAPEPQQLGYILRDDLKLLANYAQAGVTVFRDASRINPERDSVAIYTAPAPAPAPQRETNVVEALRRCLDELKGHNDSPYCDFRDSFNDIMEQAESALGAKNVDRAPHARDAVAWMPDTGYVFAPDKNTSHAPAPQREWVSLDSDDLLKLPSFDYDAPQFIAEKQFVQAVDAALKEKNHG